MSASGEKRTITIDPIRELLKAANIVNGPHGARRATHEALLRLAEDERESGGSES